MRNNTIKVFNSITKQLDNIPLSPNRAIKWYNCGPTVYNKSHLGHARNYIGIDVVRRVLEDYFDVPVEFVQNVTDIDDKIIKQAKENIYKKNKKDVHSEIENVRTYYEQDFWNDMDSLNVRRPTHTTRVSEHIDEIAKYIQTLIDKGFAYYAKDGSIYFDIEEYKLKTNYNYPALRPQHQADEIIVQNVDSNEGKKRSEDFALWKVDHEFGYKTDQLESIGRPGWHIECSAMADSICGNHLHIHSGGIDLEFPHHENEIAQSHAYHYPNLPPHSIESPSTDRAADEDNRWVELFVHVGHLNIAGQKMSKSLKNFTTIEEVLSNYSSNTVRMMILQQGLNDPMDLSDDLFITAEESLNMFKNFFINSLALKEINNYKPDPKPNSESRALAQSLYETKGAVHDALSNNFNTSLAIKELRSLVKKTNTYVKGVNDAHYHLSIILSINEYIGRILHIFGLSPFQPDSQKNSEKCSPSAIMNVFKNYRNKIRKLASSSKHYEILQQCDRVRDKELRKAGVHLEDRENYESIWIFDDQQSLPNKESTKLKKDEESSQKKPSIKQDCHPKDYVYAKYPSEFSPETSTLDNDYIPSSHIDGKPLSKRRRKKLLKEINKFVENQQKY